MYWGIGNSGHVEAFNRNYFEVFNLNAVSVKTTVTDRREVVDDHISRFLATTDSRTKVFGFDADWITHNPDTLSSNCAAVHICDETSCLIIMISHVVPQLLVNFLRHPNYIFVGFGINDNVAKLEKNYGFGCRNAVELGPMAATIMKSPRLSYCGVDELARVVNGFDLSNHRSSSIGFQWDKMDDIKELAKLVTINVYSYHMIGTKLLAQDWV
ncbi:uncharacterized protein LOC131634513 [Vicia villosa]|uniref:uncharacterized protein LOC131634513 n=1 Tax=Vicia villosa TaxID=3911 RepID=UPI00273C1CE0|nr:uncharacterized protein LOC131634513 [Vicia villosa]